MKEGFNQHYFVLLLVMPATFVLLPINSFDSGQSLCLSRVVFNFSCYACGMTRALKHLIFLDLSTAWEYHKVAFAVLPLITWLWAVEVFRVKKKLKR
jgi:hypothetical protein